jgi:GMP reductase
VLLLRAFLLFTNMRIEYEIKLDFKDVLIRPKRSTLRSRNDVDLNRNFKFRHTGKEWTGIPIMAANMDTSGTFAVAASLARVCDAPQSL